MVSCAKVWKFVNWEAILFSQDWGLKKARKPLRKEKPTNEETEIFLKTSFFWLSHLSNYHLHTIKCTFETA